MVPSLARKIRRANSGALDRWNRETPGSEEYYGMGEYACDKSEYKVSFYLCILLRKNIWKDMRIFW